MSYEKAAERMKAAAEFFRQTAAEAAEAGAVDYASIARAEVWERALTIMEEEFAPEPAALSPERA